jgi:hypothetical protein
MPCFSPFPVLRFIPGFGFLPMKACLHPHPSSEQPKITLVIFFPIVRTPFCSVLNQSVSFSLTRCLNPRQSMSHIPSIVCPASRQPRARSAPLPALRSLPPNKKRRQEDLSLPPPVRNYNRIALCLVHLLIEAPAQPLFRLELETPTISRYCCSPVPVPAPCG